MSARKYKINYALEVLNHLGRKLYRNFATVVSEAVSNSWDAGATEVRISINRKAMSMTIEDNGIGMSSNDFQDKFLTIGYSKRSDSSSFSAMKKKRVPHGRKGIGKLALLSVSERLTIITRKAGGNEISGVLDNNKIDDLIEEKANEYTLEPNKDHSNRIEDHGTILKFEKIKSRFSSPEKIRSYMALAFSFSPSGNRSDDTFDIYVNDRLVERKKDLKNLDQNTEMLWIFEDDFNMASIFSDELKEESVEKFTLSDLSCFQFKNQDGDFVTAKISGYIASVKKPSNLRIYGTNKEKDDESFKTGVHLYTNGRLRQFNIFDVIGSSSVVPSYLYGEIHVDAFDTGENEDPDMFTSSREGLLEDDSRFQPFKEKLDKILNQIIHDWSNHRREYRKKSNGEFSGMMKPRFSNAIKDYVNTDDPDERDKKVEKIINEFKNISGKDSVEERLAREKSILICHSSCDKAYADFVFHLLIELGLTSDKIIYSSAADTDNERAARLPIDGFMMYLKKFFVQHIYEGPAIVIIHSKNIKNWNPTIEVGASWISGSSNCIIQIVKYDESDDSTESERIDPPLSRENIYLELMREGNKFGRKDFIFKNQPTASQWFRKLANYCHNMDKNRKSQDKFSWDESKFNDVCESVNSKMYRNKE